MKQDAGQLTRERPLRRMRLAVQEMVCKARGRGDRAGLVEALKALLEVSDRLEEWGGARAAAEELVALAAADAQTWAALADARANLGDYAGAAPAYAQAAGLAPDEPMLRRTYADTLLKLGRLGEATLQLDAAERLEPASPYLALHRAELAQAQRDRVDAAVWATEALRRQPGWSEAQAVLRWAQATQGATDDPH